MKQVLFTLVAILALSTAGNAQTPEDMIRWVYMSLSTPGSADQKGLWYMQSQEQRSNYFTRRMVAFYDANDTYGNNLAEACVDFGFSIPGQDYDEAEIARTLSVATAGDTDRQIITASFSTFNIPTQVTYEFVPEDGFWKIDDIAGQGFRVSEIPCSPKAASQTSTAAEAAYCFRNDLDMLRLDLLPNGAARVEFSSVQSNGHSCSGVLSGQQDAAGWSFPAEQGCLLQLRVATDGGIDVFDPDYACKFMMCGQRAVLEGLRFPHSDRVDCSGWISFGN